MFLPQFTTDLQRASQPRKRPSCTSHAPSTGPADRRLRRPGRAGRRELSLRTTSFVPEECFDNQFLAEPDHELLDNLPDQAVALAGERSVDLLADVGALGVEPFLGC